MISQIELQHFKCFEILKLPLAELTVLSGSNASGKSSVLQALVLLHQTITEHEWSIRLMLNGNTLNLGTALDVIDKINGRHKFEIAITADGHKYIWAFSGERSEMSVAIDSVTIDQNIILSPTKLQYLLPTDNDHDTYSIAKKLRTLTYITAERIGPKEFYALKDPQNSIVVGPAGEQTISLLHTKRDDPILPDLQISGIPPTHLKQVEARMRTFFPGCGLTVEKVPRINAVTLGLRTSDDTDFHRPVNVGFGLTQILPIIVAALSACKDDVLFIENPEVHLHPAGQALMGQFLADVAQAGIQVVIETHSDHILNGIRRSVKEKILIPEQVALHFFKPRSNNNVQVITPIIDSLGNIDSWPEGFFDQFDKDMNYFAGWDS
jgi:predicted ATPase